MFLLVHQTPLNVKNAKCSRPAHTQSKVLASSHHTTDHKRHPKQQRVTLAPYRQGKHFALLPRQTGPAQCWSLIKYPLQENNQATKQISNNPNPTAPQYIHTHPLPLKTRRSAEMCKKHNRRQFKQQATLTAQRMQAAHAKTLCGFIRISKLWRYGKQTFKLVLYVDRVDCSLALISHLLWNISQVGDLCVQ